jgi:non-ribosomal peptide synthetase component F
MSILLVVVLLEILFGVFPNRKNTWFLLPISLKYDFSVFDLFNILAIRARFIVVWASNSATVAELNET